jgi:hypothetical protein
MIKIDQTILHNDEDDDAPSGNCLQACIASILEMDIDEVPHFVERKSADWFDVMNQWLIDNAECYLLPLNQWMRDFTPHGYALASGDSPRGIPHSVVVCDGVVVHDPHPSKGGILKVREYWLFVSLMNSKEEDSNE